MPTGAGAGTRRGAGRGSVPPGARTALRRMAAQRHRPGGRAAGLRPRRTVAAGRAVAAAAAALAAYAEAAAGGRTPAGPAPGDAARHRAPLRGTDARRRTRAVGGPAAGALPGGTGLRERRGGRTHRAGGAGRGSLTGGRRGVHRRRLGVRTGGPVLHAAAGAGRRRLRDVVPQGAAARLSGGGGGPGRAAGLCHGGGRRAQRAVLGGGVGGVNGHPLHGAYARLHAWQGLYALLDLPAETPFLEAVRYAAGCRWLRFMAFTRWFRQDTADVGLAVLDPSGTRVSVLAATDTDD